MKSTKTNKQEQLVRKVTNLIGEVLEAMKDAKTPYEEAIKATKTYVTPEESNRETKLTEAEKTPNTGSGKTKEIFEYIRERKSGISHKVGIIWGTMDGDTIKIGWSKCNRRAGDDFDLLLGLEYAKNRAFGAYEKTKVPDRNRKQMREFVARSIRYFKGATRLEASL